MFHVEHLREAENYRSLTLAGHDRQMVDLEPRLSFGAILQSYEYTIVEARRLAFQVWGIFDFVALPFSCWLVHNLLGKDDGNLTSGKHARHSPQDHGVCWRVATAALDGETAGLDHALHFFLGVPRSGVRAGPTRGVSRLN